MEIRLRIFVSTFCCLIMFACSKHEVTNPTGTKLVKIRTNGADSLGNNCPNCFVTQIFSYDGNGKLLTITDSVGRGILPSPSMGPSPFRLSNNYYHTFQYNDQGKLLKAGRDTFLYNNNNQLVQRLRRITSDTSRYWLINTFLYDSKGRLITDTSYAGQTSLNPSVIPDQITTFFYDANDNIVKVDYNSVWPAGTSTHKVYTSNYDNKINPFKYLGFIPYLAFNAPFLLSSNNPLTQDFQYEYNDNGLLKKISNQSKSIIQEYIYE